MKKFKVGDILKVIVSPGVADIGATAVVERADADFVYLKWLDEKANGQRPGGYYRRWFELATKTNTLKVIKPGSQNDMLLKHLTTGKTITRIQADHLYRIASLTRRVCDLKAAGHNITATTKIDPTGRQYVEYALVTRDRFGNRKAA